MEGKKLFYFDLIERTVWTFIQSFAGAYLSPVVIPVDMLEPIQTLSFMGKVVFAASVGFASVLKSLIANKLPWTAEGSASTLPASVDPPVEVQAPPPRKKTTRKKTTAKKTTRKSR